MRWSPHSWRAVADMLTDDGQPDLPWRHSAATMAVARLDLAYRAVYATTGEVPPLVWLGLEGSIEMWWPTTRDARSPFVGADQQRWTLPPDLDLLGLAPFARQGRLQVDLVTQVGVTADHRVLLADLAHFGEVGVESATEPVDSVLGALEAGLGAPPLTVERPERSTIRPVFTAGRPLRGLWLAHVGDTWHLQPPGVCITPVGWHDLEVPEPTGEPKQRSTP